MTVGVCVDVGSTFTKAAAVDLEAGTLLATAEHRTTVDTDVLHGLDAAVDTLKNIVLGQIGRLSTPRTMFLGSSVDVCSSAGGGLRLAVVGYEELVSAEAAHRVGLSAGARVVHVAAGRLDRSSLSALRACRPDVILLVGGTDGGDADVLLHNARILGSGRIRVVLAGNQAVRAQALALLGPNAVATENVLPRIGELNPLPARAAIRDVFLRHVIGGKKLSRGSRFASLVRGATPEVVLTAVEFLADTRGGDILVVDVGGATTDVYSALNPQSDETREGQEPEQSADVAGTLWRSRTVEGDLGVRWNAPSVVAAAERERLLRPADQPSLMDAAERRAADTTFVPVDADDHTIDLRLAELAATTAIRRHARGRDLSRVRVLIGSGGVLRHQPVAAAEMLRQVLLDHAGGWALPRAADVVVDCDYVLAPVGLLAGNQPQAAAGLLRHLVM